MGDASLARAKAARDKPKASSWALTGTAADETQVIVATSLSRLPYCQALFLHFDRPGGGWLRALQEVAPVSQAARSFESFATSVGISAAGLRAMQPPCAQPTSTERGVPFQRFSDPFLQGMHQQDRQRRLGDPPDAPDWCSNGRAHALVLLYGRDEGALASLVTRLEAALAEEGAEIVHRRLLHLKLQGRRVFEHFGFADGLSQPIPFSRESETAVVTKMGSTERMQPDKWHGVPAGDLLFGHRNAYDEVAPGPIVRESAAAKDLPQGDAPPGFRDLGRNGSYLVVRELRQHVAKFRSDMQQAAAVIGKTGDWLAERAVGRTREGKLLRPAGGAAGDPESFRSDPHGLGCPLGSHVRRANPRDGFATSDSVAATLLDAVNNHRILRRARSFGPPLPEGHAEDGQERGLMFMCLNTDIARQFEFIQQTWLLNKGFAALAETDPLLGPKGPFTIPGTPARLCTEVQALIEMQGGEYFFLPSLPAIGYLEQL